jgi:hypothetical protein
MKARWFEDLFCLLARLDIRMAKSIEAIWKTNLKQFKRNLELLDIFYLNPQGDIQGPFMGIDIIQWFHYGFYGVKLLVTLPNFVENASFVPLGDLMRHLKGNIQQTQHQSIDPCPITKIELHVCSFFLYA